jgi:hypothetical protein
MIINARNNFLAKVSEVERYFVFLRDALEPGAHIAFGTAGGTQRLDTDLQKILKANSFLILYNLVESTVQDCLTAIYDAIRTDGLSYIHVRSEVQSVWRRYHANRLREASKDKHSTEIHFLISSAVQRVVMDLNRDYSAVSGNLDARKIREIAKAFGFSATVDRSARGGFLLVTVKDERNNLGHGLKSFSECGRDYTYDQLVECRDQAIAYLRSVIQNVDAYLTAKEYAETVARTLLLAGSPIP